MADSDEFPIIAVPEEEKARLARFRLDHLRPGSDASRIVYTSLSQNSMTRREVQQLIDMLKNPKAKPLGSQDSIAWIFGSKKVHPEYTEMAAAAWALGRIDMSPELKAEATEVLIETLSNRKRKVRKIAWRNALRGFRSSYVFFSIVSVLIYLAAIPCSSGGALHPITIFLFIFLTVTVGGGTFFSWLFTAIAAEQSNEHREILKEMAAVSLSRMPVPQSVDVLAGGLARVYGEERVETYVAALMKALPTLTAEHYGTLSPDTVPHLCRALLSSYYFSRPTRVTFKMAILEAFEKIGTGRAVEAVTWIAKEAQEPTLRETATRILPILQERQRQETNSGTLLRPSQEGASPETLLRAAGSGSSETPPQELLRPSTGETPPDK